MRYRMSSFGAISRTLWPCAVNNLAQWCAPKHASMPITHGGSDASSVERQQPGSRLDAVSCPHQTVA
jgi:hypothetical protein